MPADDLPYSLLWLFWSQWRMQCWIRGREEVWGKKHRRKHVGPLTDLTGAEERTSWRLVVPLTAVLNRAASSGDLFNHESRSEVQFKQEKTVQRPAAYTRQSVSSWSGAAWGHGVTGSNVPGACPLLGCNGLQTWSSSGRFVVITSTDISWHATCTSFTHKRKIRVFQTSALDL